MLRSKAFHQLVENLWQENEERPGCGLLSPDGIRAIPLLVNVIGDASSPHVDRVAWLLGLLVEALDRDGACVARDIIRQDLPVFLAAVDRLAHAAPRGGASLQWQGLLFLLGHFFEDASRILDRLGAAAGSGSPPVQTLRTMFAAASHHPERSKFILTYLGAEACSTSLDPRLGIDETALACPVCHGRLDYQEHHINCLACDLVFGWRGDIPDLVEPGCTDPEQYPEAIVGIYESQSRLLFSDAQIRDLADRSGFDVTDMGGPGQALFFTLRKRV